MYYKDFKGENLSALGFGAMRLPLVDGSQTVDRELVFRMVDYAISHGVNYFDTAAPYHGGTSETVLGEALSRYPRESFLLADKFPGHQHSPSFDPQGVFERQLAKCRVDYFDFYLMHNVCENSIEDYLNPRWGMLDYFVGQKKSGRIRHLGFSSHAEPECLKSFLESPYGEHMEFCQIQLNYLDWTLQRAEEKVAILKSYGIPIWVMEPVRGGLLAHLGEDASQRLERLSPGSSNASWAFRWLQGIPEVTMILSGMSDMAQMEDNVSTFASCSPLSAEENDVLSDIASGLHQMAPCTACRYCCDGCPAGLDIPTLVASYNDLSIGFNLTPMMRIENLPEDKRPSACLGCGACAEMCPQNIHIPDIMSSLSELYNKYPKWSDICRERNALAAAEMNEK